MTDHYVGRARNVQKEGASASTAAAAASLHIVECLSNNRERNGY